MYYTKSKSSSSLEESFFLKTRAVMNKNNKTNTLSELVSLATCDESNLNEQAGEQNRSSSAFEEILALIAENELEIIDLLREMDKSLTSENAKTRQRATELLSESVRKLMQKEEKRRTVGGGGGGGTRDDFDHEQKKREAMLLMQFFAAKTREVSTLRSGLDGCLFSVKYLYRLETMRKEAEEEKNAKNESNEKEERYSNDDDVIECIDNVCEELFEQVHAPALAHRERQKVYNLLAELLRTFPEGVVLGVEQSVDVRRKKAVSRLERIVANCDGERDPRNVLALCQLWRELPKAFNEADRNHYDKNKMNASNDENFQSVSAQAFVANCEEVYDIVAAYFPISFKPPQNDSVKITREELASGLRSAMTATNCYAEFAIPHVLESVVSSGDDNATSSKSGEVCADAIDCLEKMSTDWPDEDIATDSICKNAWSRLRLCIISPKDLEWSRPVRRATARLLSNKTTFSTKILNLALEDQSLTTCEEAFKAYIALKREKSNMQQQRQVCNTAPLTPTDANSDEEQKDEAMELEDGGDGGGGGGGCCGGGCGKAASITKSDEIETAARVAASVVGWCLGAVAAANKDAAKIAVRVKLRKLLDILREDDESDDVGMIEEEVEHKNVNEILHWRSIAMVMITPTLGGALDAALLSPSPPPSPNDEEILGGEMRDILCDTLVAGLRTFTCRTKDHDGIVISIACASAYLQFPEFSVGDDAKKSYEIVLEALFWLTTTALDEEIVFEKLVNIDSDDGKDGVSTTPSIADESEDRRLRAKDALVAAITSTSSSNGVLAGQTISKLIEYALFDESPGHADRRRRSLELCLAIVTYSSKSSAANDNNNNKKGSLGKRAFREKVVGGVARLLAENPALRLRETTATDCLLACLRTRALEQDIISENMTQDVKMSEDALSAELCARLSLGSLGFGLPEMNANFVCATMACSTSEAQVALVAMCCAVVLGQVNGNFENACAGLCGCRAIVLSDEKNELLKATTQRLIDIASGNSPYETYSVQKKSLALHAVSSMLHKRGIDRFFPNEKSIFSREALRKLVYQGASESGLLLRALLFSPEMKTDLNTEKLDTVLEAFLGLLSKEGDDGKAYHVSGAFHRALLEEYANNDNESEKNEFTSIATDLLGFRSFDHGFRKPVRAQRFVTETTKKIRELSENKISAHVALAIVALASSSSTLISSSLTNSTNVDILLTCVTTALLSPKKQGVVNENASELLPAMLGAVRIASTFFESPSAFDKDGHLTEKHASKLLLAICASCSSASSASTNAAAAVDAKVRALETLAKCGGLPFNAIYPSRFEVYENCRSWLDDPKRRVRRAAAAACSVWAPLVASK